MKKFLRRFDKGNDRFLRIYTYSRNKFLRSWTIEVSTIEKLEKFDVHRKSVSGIVFLPPRHVLKIYHKRFYDDVPRSNPSE